MTAYDIIGDLHGCADKLEGLLVSLGYREHLGVYRQVGRQAIFVGDLVDRGNQQLRTINVVRSMVDEGAAQGSDGQSRVQRNLVRSRRP